MPAGLGRAAGLGVCLGVCLGQVVKARGIPKRGAARHYG
jgi:hypothetical protein